MTSTQIALLVIVVIAVVAVAALLILRPGRRREWQ
jgi:hypothetical protein